MVPVILGAFFALLEKVFEKAADKSAKVRCRCAQLKKKCRHKKGS